MRIKKHIFESKGLTLIEVLVAVFLLMVVLVPLLEMFVVSARGWIDSEQGTIALNLCREHLENCITAGYDELEGLVGDDYFWQPCPEYKNYEWRVTVTDYNPTLEIKTIAVQVRPAGARKKGVILATLIARWP